MSTETINPENETPEMVTPEQRRWANSILRLAGAGDSRVTDRKEGEADDDEDEDEGLYSKGLEKFKVFTDERPTPQAYTNALVKGAPIISSGDWENVMKGRAITKEQLEDLNKDKDKLSSTLSGLPAKITEKTQKVRIYNALKKAKDDNTSCDLREFGLNVIAKKDVLKAFQTADQESDRLIAEVKEAGKLTSKILVALDSPQNNPEHLEVGAKLKELEEFEKKYPTPRVGEKEKAYVKEKAQMLFSLQAVAFKWNDRRTSENLPPSSDSMAVTDMVQRAHRELIATAIDKGLPMPLSKENEDSLTEQEKEALQKTWKGLVDSEKNGSKDGARVVVKTPPTGTFIANKEVAKQFRLETLANLSLLLQTQAGRSMIGDINKGKHTVDFAPSDSEACSRPGDNTAMTKGVGCSSTVKLIPGCKDSDDVLWTKDGCALSCPVFISLGHELTHAMHNSKGENRRELPMTQDTMWNNEEEYRTITKGKVSEQTIRQQCGLSAERFGHLTPSTNANVTNALAKGLETTLKMSEKNPTQIDSVLKKRKFEPANFPDKLKLEVADSDLEGPLPNGWEPAQLTFAQLKDVIGPPPIPGDLGKYGWTPFGLNKARMQEILNNEEHHPRSAKGIRFRNLGGDDSFGEFKNFNDQTGATLNTTTPTKWTDKLKALETAEKSLLELAKNATSENVKKLANGKGKLGKRLSDVVKEFYDHKEAFATFGGDQALSTLDVFNTSAKKVDIKVVPKGGTDIFDKVETLRTAETLLSSNALSQGGKKALGSGNLASKLTNASIYFEEAVLQFAQLGGEPAVTAAFAYKSLPNVTGMPQMKTTASIFEKRFYLNKATESLKALSTNGVECPSVRNTAKGTNLTQALQAVVTLTKQFKDEYNKLGGLNAFNAIDTAQIFSGTTLQSGAADDETRSIQIKEAEKALTNFYKDAQSEQFKICASNLTLDKKVDKIAEHENRLRVAEQEYKALGEETAFKAIGDAGILAEVKLSAVGVDNESRVREIKAAHQALAKKFDSPDGIKISGSKMRLDKKIEQLKKFKVRLEKAEASGNEQDSRSEAMGNSAKNLGAKIDDVQLAKDIKDAKAKKSDVKEVTKAAKSLFDAIAEVNGDKVDAAITDLQNKAQAYVDHKDHANPRTKRGKARKALAASLLNKAKEARKSFDDIQVKAGEALNSVKELAKTPEDIALSIVEKYETMLETMPILSGAHKGLETEVKSLREAVEFHESEREKLAAG